MSDIRFIIIGLVLVFSGVLVLGIFGDNFRAASIESSEFGKCFQYSEEQEPMEVDCAAKQFEQNLFFGIVIALIVGGVIGLIKGVRGDWDSRVKPEDMVGPSRDTRDNANDLD